MWRQIAFLIALLPLPAAAQSVVVSPEPEAVSLTVYRGQSGSGSPQIDKNWPQGYALITETRTVTIPAGESVVRFEGVAEGMYPESAILSGLPKGVREKNRDARLLSPEGLVDAYLKRQVTLTRTNKSTGAVRTQDAFITAGPGGGVIIQTTEGYEALRCTGLPERLSYGGIPQNLSAKPTLSVMTQSDKPVTVKLTLTYMAAGFDWQANYVAQIRKREADGKDKVDMFAWLTLANGGNQSFLNANTMAIAGAPNKDRNASPVSPTGGPLVIECWPSQRTHEVPDYLPYELAMQYPFAPTPAPITADAAYMEDIVVTGSRVRGNAKEMAAPVAVITAEQEDIGDLKLYRVPEPVTVNAKGQKQVALLTKAGSNFEHYYHASLDDLGADSTPMALMLRSENIEGKGLGLPMPQGKVAVFEDSKYGPLLIGEDSLTDRAVGDKVKIAAGSSSDVRISATQLERRGRAEHWTLNASNARNAPVNIEVEIPYEVKGKPKGVSKVDGIPTWKATIPANGEIKLNFDLKMSNEEED